MSTTAGGTPVAPMNEETLEAWDGPLFERFVKYRHLIIPANKGFSDEAMRVHAPPRGGRAVDIGCGFGDTTQELAALVGPDGSVLGVDVAPRFIEAARREAEEAGAANARFAVMDVEAASFDERFDYAFSRFGTMFFANPVAALRRVREALVPGGQLVMVVWRAREDNEWLYKGQVITEGFVKKPDEYDEPTCGPGPFAMANADTTSGMLLSAGFEEISLRRCDLPFRVGEDIDEAVELVMDLGPAGEILRLQGERAAHLHEPIREALREGMSEFAGPDGIVSRASTWIVSARAPA